MSVLIVVFIPVEEFREDGDEDANKTEGQKVVGSDKETDKQVTGDKTTADLVEGELITGQRNDNTEAGIKGACEETATDLAEGEVNTEQGGKSSKSTELNSINNSASQSVKELEHASTASGGQVGADDSEGIADSDVKIPLLSKSDTGQEKDAGIIPSVRDVEEGRGQELSTKPNIDKFKVELVREDKDTPNENGNGKKDELPENGCEAGRTGVRFQLSTNVELETEVFSVEQVLQAVLSDLDIQTDTWTKSDDNNFWQVTFVVEKEDIDMILDRLSYYGIGQVTNTSLSIFPASYYQCGKDRQTKEDALSVGTKSLKGDPDEKNNFISSVKSRLTVAQVVEAVKTNSRFTFDFVMLIILASVIAALGLVENSSVILVASMLVSPLMGPILGVTFGLVVQNKPLFRLGLLNEAIGLGLCLLVGFMFGFMVSAVNHNGAQWGATSDWPTSEMKARGVLRSLWVGLLVALPSGAGVAFSILGGNVGSLVGVAISASLLPPAVNAGMLWAYGFVSLIKPPEFVNSGQTFQNFNVTQAAFSNVSDDVSRIPPNCGALEDNSYIFHYTCHMPSEAFLLGTVSLALTLLNILCIFAMGVAVLKIKEVAPRTAIADGTDKFWKSDIQVAREAYKTLKTSSPSYSEFSNLAKRIAQEEKEKDIKVPMSELFEDITTDNEFKTIQSRLMVKSLLKMDQFFPKHTSHYTTVGPAAIWRPGQVSMVTEPGSPVPSTPDLCQQTWMGLRHRKDQREDQMSVSAGVLNHKKNPFRFPQPTNIGKGKRTPRQSLWKQISCQDDEQGNAKPTNSVSAGRFEISSVPEERRGSRVSTIPSSTQL